MHPSATRSTTQAASNIARWKHRCHDASARPYHRHVRYPRARPVLGPKGVRDAGDVESPSGYRGAAGEPQSPGESDRCRPSCHFFWKVIWQTERSGTWAKEWLQMFFCRFFWQRFTWKLGILAAVRCSAMHFFKTKIEYSQDWVANKPKSQTSKQRHLFQFSGAPTPKRRAEEEALRHWMRTTTWLETSNLCGFLGFLSLEILVLVAFWKNTYTKYTSNKSGLGWLWP